MENTPTEKAFRIEGMSCTGCEQTLERGLLKLDGVQSVHADYGNGRVDVGYDSTVITPDALIAAIKKLGYSASEWTNSSKENSISADKSVQKSPFSINQILAGVMILYAVYLVVKNTVGFNFVPTVTPGMGYGILFVVGLMTSIHCIAMCGGISLSQCVSPNPAAQNGPVADKLKPSFLYNAGRVISYTLIGGIAGALGSAVSFSGQAKGLVAIASGVFMVLMGLNMLNIFPGLRKLMPQMPRAIRNSVSGTGRGPFFVGLLNGLMPCGPLQAMQIYALGTGSFTAGALSMLAFSLGTVPLMFSFGALSSFLSARFTKRMMTVSAILVMLLGVVMMTRGLSLSGFAVSNGSQPVSSGAVATNIGNLQEITTTLTSAGYPPIVVQKNVPVRWNMKADAKDINGCNGTLVVPAFNIQKKLVPGDNIIEFTPTTSGTIPYSCWMGMIRSTIQVVDDPSKGAAAPTAPPLLKPSSSGASCCAAPPKGFANGKVPTDSVGIAQIKNGHQEVTVTVNAQGYTPAVLVLQKGIPAKIHFKPDQLTSCNSNVQFPDFQGQLILPDQTETPWLTPTQDFSFQCGMGMLHGFVKVVDDLQHVNMDDVRTAAQNFVPTAASGGGGCCGN